MQMRIIPGQDKFLRLHIDDLSLPIRRSSRANRIKSTSPAFELDTSLASVIVAGAAAGGITGAIAAYLIGMLPQ
jgi:hypothetical protein